MALADRRRPPPALVLRALALGDLLTAVPALRALGAALPGHPVVLAVPAGLAPLAELTGAIDAVLPAAELAPLDWRGDPPGLAVNLHGRGPQSTRLLQALRPGRLVAYACPELGVEGLAWREEEREVDRWCRLVAEGLGAPADPDALAIARPAVASPAPGAAVVHPGAAYGSRRWPADRFAAVAAGLRARGLPVVVTGSGSERELAEQVAGGAGLPPEAVLAGRTTLADLAALVADAALVVAGDTGVAHLATAYAVPSVVLFGPALPSVWGPPPGRAQHVALWHGAGRRPGAVFADVPDPALLAIAAPEVLAAADRALRSCPAVG